MLANQSNPNAEVEVKEVQSAARALGIQLTVMNGNSQREVEAVFGSFDRYRPDSFSPNNRCSSNLSVQLVALAARHALPAIYPTRVREGTAGS